MRFHGFQVSDVRSLCRLVPNLCGGGAARKETFTRSQLAAISSISIDCYGFPKVSWDFMGSRKPIIKTYFPKNDTNCQIFSNMFRMSFLCFPDFVDILTETEGGRFFCRNNTNNLQLSILYWNLKKANGRDTRISRCEHVVWTVCCACVDCVLCVCVRQTQTDLKAALNNVEGCDVGGYDVKLRW